LRASWRGGRGGRGGGFVRFCGVTREISGGWNGGSGSYLEGLGLGGEGKGGRCTSPRGLLGGEEC
jgi:hypothetical protein